MTDDLIVYTEKDLERILGFKRTKMTQLLCSGVLPAVKIGKSWRITKKDLEKWFDDNKGLEIVL